MSKIEYVGHCEELEHLAHKYPLTWVDMINSSITNKDLRYIYDKWKLTKRQKQCITHYYLNGKTQVGIAVELGISQPMVNKHLKYAKKKAQKWLLNEHK